MEFSIPWNLAESDNIPVTELLGTDLHRLLTSRPLEKQFIQYFLYQILVRYASPTPTRHD